MDNRRLAGLLLGTHDLEKMRANYINPDFLRNRYPEVVARNRLFYLLVVYFSPEIRSMGFFSWLVSIVFKTILDICDVCVADASDSRIILKDLVDECATNLGIPHTTEILGTQTYFAIRHEVAD